MTVSKAPQQPATCRDAIAAVWPSELQPGALTVLIHENRSERPNAVGAVNQNGSRDYGCFQINDAAHPRFFASEDWSNPLANAAEALAIYQGRQTLTGNGWQAWYAVQNILW